jgi:hypothetical protein
MLAFHTHEVSIWIEDYEAKGCGRHKASRGCEMNISPKRSVQHRKVRSEPPMEEKYTMNAYILS